MSSWSAFLPCCLGPSFLTGLAHVLPQLVFVSRSSGKYFDSQTGNQTGCGWISALRSHSMGTGARSSQSGVLELKKLLVDTCRTKRFGSGRDLRSHDLSHGLWIPLVPNNVRIIRHVCLPRLARLCQVARARSLIPMFVKHILRDFKWSVSHANTKLLYHFAHCDVLPDWPLDGMNEQLIVHPNQQRSLRLTQDSRAGGSSPPAAYKGRVTSAPSAELSPSHSGCRTWTWCEIKEFTQWRRATKTCR